MLGFFPPHAISQFLLIIVNELLMVSSSLEAWALNFITSWSHEKKEGEREILVLLPIWFNFIEVYYLISVVSEISS